MKNISGKYAIDIAHAFYNGGRLEKNIEKSIKWYKISSEKGNAEAAALLGFMFYEGKNVVQN